MFVLPARQIVALFFLIRIASGRLVFVPPNLDGSYVYIHVYISLYIYIYIYVCVYVCMYVCMYVCIHTYIHILHDGSQKSRSWSGLAPTGFITPIISLSLYTYIYIYIHVYMYICTYICPTLRTSSGGSNLLTACYPQDDDNVCSKLFLPQEQNKHQK